MTKVVIWGLFAVAFLVAGQYAWRKWGQYAFCSVLCDSLNDEIKRCAERHKCQVEPLNCTDVCLQSMRASP